MACRRGGEELPLVIALEGQCSALTVALSTGVALWVGGILLRRLIRTLGIGVARTREIGVDDLQRKSQAFGLALSSLLAVFRDTSVCCYYSGIVVSIYCSAPDCGSSGRCTLCMHCDVMLDGFGLRF